MLKVIFCQQKMQFQEGGKRKLCESGYNKLLKDIPNYSEKMILKRQKWLTKKIMNVVMDWQNYNKESIHVKLMPKLISCIQFHMGEFQFWETKFRLLQTTLNEYEKIKRIQQNFAGVKTSEIDIGYNAQMQGFLQTKNYRGYKSLNVIMVNEIAKKITEQDTELPDMRNLSCCRFLYKKWRLTPHNQTNDQYIYHESYSNQIKSSICGLLNSDGGFIFIGINQKSRQVQGLVISEQEKQQINLKLNRQKYEIEPFRYSLKIDFIPVFNFEKDDEKGLYVIRVKVRPEQVNLGLSYLVLKRRGFHDIYETYACKNGRVLLLSGQQFYKQMENRFKIASRKVLRKNNKIRNQTYVQPYKGNILYEDEKKILLSECKLDLQKGKLSQFEFKYDKLAFIILGSTLKLNKKSELQDKLRERKIGYQIIQPFKEYQPQNGRQCYILNHNGKIKVVKKLVRDVDMSWQTLTTKLYLKTLSISLKQRLQEVYEQGCGRMLLIQSEQHNKNNVKNVRIVCSNISYTVFTFVWLQYNNVRVNFMN